MSYHPYCGLLPRFICTPSTVRKKMKFFFLILSSGGGAKRAKNLRWPHKLKTKRTRLHILSSSLMFRRCLTDFFCLYLGSGRTPKTFSEKFISLYSRSWLESVGGGSDVYTSATHPDFRSSDNSSGGSRCDCGNGQMLEAQFSQPIWLRIVILWLFYVPVCRPLEISL